LVLNRPNVPVAPSVENWRDAIRSNRALIAAVIGLIALSIVATIAAAPLGPPSTPPSGSTPTVIAR
jgi:hypothetical protein